VPERIEVCESMSNLTILGTSCSLLRGDAFPAVWTDLYSREILDCVWAGLKSSQLEDVDRQGRLDGEEMRRILARLGASERALALAESKYAGAEVMGDTVSACGLVRLS